MSQDVPPQSEDQADLFGTLEEMLLKLYTLQVPVLGQWVEKLHGEINHRYELMVAATSNQEEPDETVVAEYWNMQRMAEIIRELAHARARLTELYPVDRAPANIQEAVADLYQWFGLEHGTDIE